MDSPDADFIDYYALLGLKPSADAAQIRRAFLGRAKQLHPDTGGSTAEMQRLNKAYKTLISPTVKPIYDRSHNFHTNHTTLSEYRYQDDMAGKQVNAQGDAEIDAFLDGLLKEYRNGVPKRKQTAIARLKAMLKF